MKGTLAIVAIVLVLVVSAALYSRSLDPRPAGLAMQAALSRALDDLRHGKAGGDFAVMAERYATLAHQFAVAELALGSDADLRLYAQRVVGRPALGAGRLPEVVDLEAVHENLLVALDMALLHVGTPDDRFVQAMIPLETAIAELGRLADAGNSPTAFRATDPATLMAASGAVALAGWTGTNTHSH